MHLLVNTVVNLIDKFMSTGSVLTKKSSGRPRTARTNEITASVSESVEENPSTSIRRRSQQLSISRSSLQRILTKDLHLYAYKVQLTQALKQHDHASRRAFANWVLENQRVDSEFKKNHL